MRKFTLVLALILFIGMQGVFAQLRVISGVVTSSEDKAPIPGVTIVVKSTTIGTTTNLDGKYTLTVPAKYDAVEFSFVGMKTQIIKIGSSATLDVVMEPDVMNMSEVVVTAIGIPRETKALSYSVQNLGSEDIDKAGQSDIINSLVGKVSDVQIVSSAGVAGSSSYIQIRGVQSITQSNQPLFIIDGVPIDNSGGGNGSIVDGVNLSNRAVDINPDDIASVSVLKGGAATALYGLQAASGAIVITTKKGTAGSGKRINVSFNTSVQFDQVSQLPKRQNEYGQGSGGKWGSGNRLTWGPKLDTCSYDPILTGSYANGNWNYWPGFDVGGAIVSKKYHSNDGQAVKTYNPYDFFQTGVTTNNSLSLSGGTDVSTYYFSFSDNQQKGIVPNNKFRRNTFKISGNSKLGNKVKVAGNANYIITTADRIQQGSNTSGVMLGLLRTPSTFDNSAGYLNPMGDTIPDLFQRSYRHGRGYDNPYWTASMNDYNDKVNRLIGDAQIDYLATKWLTFTYRAGVDYWERKVKDQLSVGSNTQPAGWSKSTMEETKNFNQDIMMTIDKDFAKDFNIHFVLGNNIYEAYYYGLFSQANGLIIPGFYNLSNTTSISSQETTQELRRAAFYGDATLSWKNMLYLSVTGRNDWSTTLPKGKNSFFYPSVGLGWIFTQLPGLKDNKVLPYGKLRFSYAVVAKDADPYRVFSTYASPVIADGWTTGLTWPFQGVTGYANGAIIINNIQFSQIGNANLKPEKTNSIELGIDLKFIQNRVGVSYTYFNNKGQDLLLPVTIPASSGFLQVEQNAASMRTTGHEITLDLVPIKTKDWEWDITVNFSTIKNKVLALAPGINTLFLGGFTDPQVRAVVGSPYRTIYGFDWMRNADGKVIIDDSGSPDPMSPNYNSNYGFPTQDPTMKPLGNVDPNWTMAPSTKLRWKDISLYLLFDIKSGGKMWNGTRGVMDYFGTSQGTADRDLSYVFDGVLASNGGTNNISVYRDQNWRNGAGSGFSGPSVDYIEKADWVRLRTLTLSYSLTRLLKGTFIKTLEVYFTGTNLWLSTPYTGIDPETNLLGNSNAQGFDYFNMPGSKSYTLGLSMAF